MTDFSELRDVQDPALDDYKKMVTLEKVGKLKSDYNLGKEHCAEGRVPSMGMSDDYYRGYESMIGGEK